MAGVEEDRKNLNLNRLKPDERSEMFQEFQKSGGKVVEIQEDGMRKKLSRLETLVKQTAQQKEETKSPGQDKVARQLDDFIDSKESTESAKHQKNKRENRLEEKLSKMISKKKSPNPLVKPFNAFLSRFICILSGIFPMFRMKFTHSFVNLTLFDLKTALKNLTPLLTSLLYQNESFSRKIRKELILMGLTDYFELIYRTDKMLDEESFSILTKSMIASGKSVFASEKAFLRLYKSFYVLYPYRNAVKDAIEAALKLEKQMKNLRDGVVSSNITYMKKNIDFVFYRYLPKINQLIDFYYKKALLRGKKIEFKTFVGINKEDQIGYYTRQWQEDLDREEQRQKREEAKQKETEKEADSQDPLQRLKEDTNIDSPAKRGIEMIYWYLDFQNLLQKLYDDRDHNHVIRIQDKIFLILSLLNFFDEEFSFLFVSQKVKYNVFFDHLGRRVDIKNQLKDHYFKLNEIYQKEREYLKVMNNIAVLTHGFTTELDEHSPEFKRVSYQREQILRMVRNESRKVVDEFVSILDQMVSDLNADRNILQSPEEVMIFESKLTTHRLCSRRTFADSFLMAHQVACAIQYFLTDGELGGIQLEDSKPKYLKIPSENPKTSSNKYQSVEEDIETGLPITDIDNIVPDL